MVGNPNFLDSLIKTLQVGRLSNDSRRLQVTLKAFFQVNSMKKESSAYTENKKWNGFLGFFAIVAILFDIHVKPREVSHYPRWGFDTTQ